MYAGSVPVENNPDNETSNYFSSSSCHAVALQGRAHVLATSSCAQAAAAAVTAVIAAAAVAAAVAVAPPRKEKRKEKAGIPQGQGGPTGVWDDPRIPEFS